MAKGGAKNVSDSYHHGDLRRAMLDSALDLLTEQGEAALSLREIARSAGVSHAAPYRHFPDRDALLAALNDEGFAALLRELEAAAESLSAAAPRKRLLAVAEAYVGFALTQPARYRLMFGGPRRVSGDPVNVPGATFDYVAGLVSACQARGQLRRGDPARLTTMVWSMLHGIASLVLEGRLDEKTPRDPTRLARDAIDAFLRGMAPNAR